MNEQIQHLATRAGLYVDSNGRPYPQALSAEQADAALQKFAELIVKECVRVSGPEDSYTDEWFKAKADSVAKIKQHFGVEE